MNPSEQLSKDFKRGEFACKDGCGFAAPNPDLVTGLQKLRDKIGKAIIIDDACRCKIHNAKVGGVPDSQHVLGEAADIRVPGLSARALYAEACAISEFHAFGVDDHEQYIHVDVRPLVRPRWCYVNGKQAPWHEAK